MFKFALCASLLAVLTATAAQAATNIIDVSKDTLVCREVGTGSDVDIKVEQIQTRVEFENGGSQGGITRRTMELRVGKTTARTVIQSPNLMNVPNNKLDEAFLTKNAISSDGSEHIVQSSFYDQNKAHYPAALLRLKVAIPKESRRTRGEQTQSHLSINMVMPESRLQVGKFMASGYVGLYLEENRQNAEFTVGLAKLECEKTYEELIPEPCLTKKEENQMTAIETKIQQAMKSNPGCEKSYGAAACIPPFEQAVLRMLKDRRICN